MSEVEDRRAADQHRVLAALIDAAGGEIIVHPAHLERAPEMEITKVYDPTSGTIRYRVRRIAQSD